MKSKISDNKCHNIDTNNQNDKIPESAPSELRHTTTNENNHKNISKNESNNENKIMKKNKIMGTKATTKITVIRTRETASIVMMATATVTAITIAVAKKTI